MLYGRTSERVEIDRLLDEARRGRSGVLIIDGEAGIGKTALLDYAAEAADEIRVLRGTGIEFEAELPFSFLHLFLHGELAHLAALPPVQADALGTALGRRSPTTDDRFLVGQAVLSLLAEAADDAPLLCLIDDYQWIDRASTEALLFAARRLEAEGIVIVMAGRDVPATTIAVDLPRLWLQGLDRDASLSLLADHDADLPIQVRDWVLVQAAGNPLALLVLPQLLSPEQRLGELPLHAFPAGTADGVNRLEEAFAVRFTALPDRAQDFVLVAAAEDTGDLQTVLAAASRLGVVLTDTVPAEQSDLVSLEGQWIRFRHPLCRAAVYGSAPMARQVAVHRALADVLSCPAAADRRAWHLAAAATGPDEDAAHELEAAAKRAAQRGGRAAVAAAYARAAQLSSDQFSRGRRLTEAAGAAAEAGLLDRAADLAESAVALVTDPLQLASLAEVRGGVARARGHYPQARTILISTAERVASKAPHAAARLLFEAISAACTAGDIADIESVARILGSTGLTERTGELPVVDAVLAVTDIAAGRPESGVPLLRSMLARMCTGPDSFDLRERARVSLNLLIGDVEAGHQLASALEDECRRRGAIGVLPDALLLMARSQVLVGHHHNALANATEGLRIATDTGQRQNVGPLTSIIAYIAAVEGDSDKTHDLVTTIEMECPEWADTWRPTLLGLLSLLDIGQGRHEVAFDRLKGMTRQSRLLTLPNLPLLVEVATTLDEPAYATLAHEQFSAWALQSGKPWPTAIMLRCQALVASSGQQVATVDDCFVRAIELHKRNPQSFEHARTRLLYGEWLRRRRRRMDARTQLRVAMELFGRLDAKPWTARAGTELRATGDTEALPQRSTDPLRRLTPQEVQVVRLAAQGLSNPAIGARLFLSPRTIAYHLHKSYRKLGVANRSQLTHLVTRDGSLG